MTAKLQNIQNLNIKKTQNSRIEMFWKPLTKNFELLK